MCGSYLYFFKKVRHLFTEDELTLFAIDFLDEYFNLPLQIPIKRNNRLRSTLGRYVMNAQGKPARIELSGNLLTYGKKETIIGVLKHECIHYAYHVQGKNMQDGNPEFELALKQHNAPSTETLKVGKYYIYECEQCKQTGETRLKRLVQRPEDYRTACCKGRLNIVGEKIYRG